MNVSEERAEEILLTFAQLILNEITDEKLESIYNSVVEELNLNDDELCVLDEIINVLIEFDETIEEETPINLNLAAPLQNRTSEKDFK